MYIHSLLQNHELTAIPVNDILRATLLQFDKLQLQNKLNEYPVAYIKQADLSSSKRLIRAIEIAEYLSNNEQVPISRPEIKPFVIGLYNDVETRRAKILKRLDDRLANGLIAEVKTLLNQGVSAEMLVFYGLEYKFVVSYLNNEIDFGTLRERLGIAICQFAKRQMTFFRKMEKDGVQINWIEVEGYSEEVSRKAMELVEHNF